MSRTQRAMIGVLMVLLFVGQALADDSTGLPPNQMIRKIKPRPRTTLKGVSGSQRPAPDTGSLSPQNASGMGVGVQIPLGHSNEAKPETEPVGETPAQTQK